MITKITLANVASYKDPRHLDSTSINLIYGLNGTGKTQISKFLANCSNQEDESFRDCNINGLNGEKILVYNQDFIDKNFYNKEKQQGIFTLSRENKEVKEEIEKIKKQIETNQQKLRHNEEKIEDYKKQITNIDKKLRDKVWSIKENYDKDFSECLKGFRSSREALCKHLLDITPNDQEKIQEIEKGLQSIKEKLVMLRDDNQKEMENFELLKIESILEIERNSIFAEEIIGNNNSTISHLIKILDNENWVNQGRKYIQQDSDSCPFCQGKTITQDFRLQLKTYFDENYENKLQQLRELKEQYESAIEKIPHLESFFRGTILDKTNQDFTISYDKLGQNLKDNIRQIEEKIKEPNKKIQLKNSQNLCDTLNHTLKEKQERLNEFNQELSAKDKTKEALKDRFWQLMHLRYKNDIKEYYKEKEKVEKETKVLDDENEKLQGEIQGYETKITEAEKDISNIQQAVKSINMHLEELGILSFRIEVIDEEKQEYAIIREGESKPAFKSLSEGEKTLISFLYFLELCQGKSEENETISSKIIVIDDPISSLSFNYVFHIAQLIKNLFFNDSNKDQLFVLTHHLYFFHELLHNKSKKTIQCFRIYRDKNYYSCIEEIKSNEILNEYQAYWQILKDYKNGKIHSAILANTMRNIMEHFLGFVQKEKIVILQNMRKEHPNKPYDAFHRYMNRESHFGQGSIVVGNEIEPKIFLDAFKDFFDSIGHSEHYSIMMGEQNESPTQN